MQNLLTAEEAIKALRLDAVGLKHPGQALRHLRRMGRLRYIRVGRRILYRESDIDSYIEENLEDATN